MMMMMMMMIMMVMMMMVDDDYDDDGGGGDDRDGHDYLRVSSLRRGHAHLFWALPISTGDPRTRLAPWAHHSISSPSS